MVITGKTSMVLMLADPVAHIRGTLVINKSFDDLGLDAAIVPIHVRPSDLASVLEAVRGMRNVVGMGITVPHKIAVIPHLDQIREVARRTGAVNFVRCGEDRRMTGTNTTVRASLPALPPMASPGARHRRGRGWHAPSPSPWLKLAWARWFLRTEVLTGRWLWPQTSRPPFRPAKRGSARLMRLTRQPEWIRL